MKFVRWILNAVNILYSTTILYHKSIILSIGYRYLFQANIWNCGQKYVENTKNPTTHIESQGDFL